MTPAAQTSVSPSTGASSVTSARARPGPASTKALASRTRSSSRGRAHSGRRRLHVGQRQHPPVVEQADGGPLGAGRQVADHHDRRSPGSAGPGAHDRSIATCQGSGVRRRLLTPENMTCQSLSITFSTVMVRFVVAPGRVTIRDVAERAGVSIATVSKVINERYGVAAATSEKVQAVIHELGYESSLVARSLRNHRTNVDRRSWSPTSSRSAPSSSRARPARSRPPATSSWSTPAAAAAPSTSAGRAGR